MEMAATVSDRRTRGVISGRGHVTGRNDRSIFQKKITEIKESTAGRFLP